MDYYTIECLAEDYASALKAEYESKLHLEQLRGQVERLEGVTLAAAYEDGTIDGKNADVRKRQEANALANDGGYQEALHAVAEAERLANAATVDVEHKRALNSLTKAWLYSQAGV